MKFHGVDMQGDLLSERVSTLPSWSSADEGRLIYANDVNLFYYGTNVAWTEVGAGGGSGTGLPLILPKLCSLDDTDVNISRGSVFNVETLDYGPTTLGTSWFTFDFPSTLDDTVDIDFKLVYNLSGSDDSKNVRMQIAYWVYGDGETPGAATGAYNTDISTGIGEDGTRQAVAMTSLPNADLVAGDTITFKIGRRSTAGEDTYTGTLQMLYIYMSQA